MLDYKGNDKTKVVAKLLANGIRVILKNREWETIDPSKEEEAQAIIDSMEVVLPTLNPRQFERAIIAARLENIIPVVIDQLENADHDLYKSVRSQYRRGGEFYFNLTWQLYSQLKPYILQVNSALNYTEEELKAIWIEESKN